MLEVMSKRLTSNSRGPGKLVTAIDGVVQIDPQSGKVTQAAKQPGARIAHNAWGRLLPRGLALFLSPSVFGKTVKVTSTQLVDSPRIEKKTAAHGLAQLTRADVQELVGEQLDPRRGALLRLEVKAAGRTAAATVLALPADYDGPIVFCDIDDTLRPSMTKTWHQKGVPQPLEGAPELLQSIADLDIPIVYLSAAPQRMGRMNHDFLHRHFPPGVLLSREMLDATPLSKQSQGRFKQRQIEAIQKLFPHAQLMGLGDDKYADHLVYQAVRARSFIRQTRPQSVSPAKETGAYVNDTYDSDFRRAFINAAKALVDKSTSFRPASRKRAMNDEGWTDR